ncbi:MAG: putative glycoside hydrolase, partial [bacterium]|nr:putative glycoside hydrolase [bacterium]
ANYPYEVLKYSMEHARTRLIAASHPKSSATGTVAMADDFTSISRLRPWLQDFNLGAKYTPEMVRAQIRATEDVLAHGTSSAMYGGWLLWNPSNVYTEAALLKE